MKLHSFANSRCHPQSRRHERGSAVMFVFILLTIMVIFTLANSRNLYFLKEEIRLIEKRQTQKYLPSGTAGKSVSTNTPPKTPEPPNR